MSVNVIKNVTNALSDFKQSVNNDFNSYLQHNDAMDNQLRALQSEMQETLHMLEQLHAKRKSTELKLTRNKAVEEWKLKHANDKEQWRVEKSVSITDWKQVISDLKEDAIDTKEYDLSVQIEESMSAAEIRSHPLYKLFHWADNVDYRYRKHGKQPKGVVLRQILEIHWSLFAKIAR